MVRMKANILVSIYKERSNLSYKFKSISYLASNIEELHLWFFYYLDSFLPDSSQTREGEDFDATNSQWTQICIKVGKSSFFKTRSQNLQAAKPTISVIFKQNYHFSFDVGKFVKAKPYMVSGSRNIGIEQAMDHHHPRMLKAVSMMKQHAKPSPAALNQKFDPFQSSKRPVRRGSDPIHNRS
ncbi:hypothetical protein R6Q59_004864 [Mikania micrantha]